MRKISGMQIEHQISILLAIKCRQWLKISTILDLATLSNKTLLAFLKQSTMIDSQHHQISWRKLTFQCVTNHNQNRSHSQREIKGSSLRMSLFKLNRKKEKLIWLLSRCQKTSIEIFKSQGSKPDQYRAKHLDRLLKLRVKDPFMIQRRCAQLKGSVATIEVVQLRTRSKYRWGNQSKSQSLSNQTKWWIRCKQDLRFPTQRQQQWNVALQDLIWLNLQKSL